MHTKAGLMLFSFSYRMSYSNRRKTVKSVKRNLFLSSPFFQDFTVSNSTEFRKTAESATEDFPTFKQGSNKEALGGKGVNCRVLGGNSDI